MALRPTLADVSGTRYPGLVIHKYSNETQTRWDKGEFKVQLVVLGNSRPMGFCEGSSEDLAELASIAESEGAGEMQISKKLLKTGREIWTLGES